MTSLFYIFVSVFYLVIFSHPGISTSDLVEDVSDLVEDVSDNVTDTIANTLQMSSNGGFGYSYNFPTNSFQFSNYFSGSVSPRAPAPAPRDKTTNPVPLVPSSPVPVPLVSSSPVRLPMTNPVMAPISTAAPTLKEIPFVASASLSGVTVDKFNTPNITNAFKKAVMLASPNIVFVTITSVTASASSLTVMQEISTSKTKLHGFGASASSITVGFSGAVQTKGGSAGAVLGNATKALASNLGPAMTAASGLKITAAVAPLGTVMPTSSPTTRPTTAMPLTCPTAAPVIARTSSPLPPVKGNSTGSSGGGIDVAVVAGAAGGGGGALLVIIIVAAYCMCCRKKDNNAKVAVHGSVDK